MLEDTNSLDGAQMRIWKNECFTTLMSIDSITIAYFYAEKGHNKA